MLGKRREIASDDEKLEGPEVEGAVKLLQGKYEAAGPPAERNHLPGCVLLIFRTNLYM